MPRTHVSGASSLRKNRITNKSRLKIERGDVDHDPIIPDEDDETTRMQQQTAGVDAEDANEHHLQAVLNQTRSAKKQAAYIPVPDSTGVVADYEELYPPNRWKDPVTYICSSATVEECTGNALADGFTYHLDDRDQAWLDKNNEEARGEGTSAQGIAQCALRTSARSAKAKGKEPESGPATVITEDEFELVMGLFEKFTHEKTEFLSHGLEHERMPFPAFSEYHDSFLTPLSSPIFAAYVVPDWVPNPMNLLRFARAIYPHWKARRLERKGNRIIPTLNSDESDSKNESYVCFRRREIKAVRKTRASQQSSSEKLSRLQSELSYPLDLAKAILNRETLKREQAVQAQNAWSKRLAMADLKRKFPALGDKADEELFVDRERPAKRSDTIAAARSLKLRTAHEAGRTPRADLMVIKRPEDRTQEIYSGIERELARQKDRDHHWEDHIDAPSPTYPQRLFKYVPPTPESSSRMPRALRLRVGRGGRRFIDRRLAPGQRFPVLDEHRRTVLQAPKGEDAMDVDIPSDSDGVDRLKGLEMRWRFDADDDAPPVGPNGVEEHDRELIDDYDLKYLRHTMTLFGQDDQAHMSVDPHLYYHSASGEVHKTFTYRLGYSSATSVPMAMSRSQHRPVQAMISQTAQIGSLTPVSVPAQIRKVQPPSMKPPQLPSQAAPSAPNSSSIQQPSVSSTLSSHVNVVNRHTAAVSAEGSVESSHCVVNGDTSTQIPHVPTQADGAVPVVSVNGAVQVASRPQHPAQVVAPNSYQMQHLNGYASSAALMSAQYLQHANSQSSALSSQQVQNLKTAFANATNPSDASVLASSRGIPYMYVPSTANFNMIPDGKRPVSWPTVTSPQRPASATNGPVVLDGTDGATNSGAPTLGCTASKTAVQMQAGGATPHMMTHSPHMNGQMMHVNGVVPYGNGQMSHLNGPTAHTPMVSSPVPSLSPPRPAATPALPTA
ncbi:hypothetical protein FISHEDRAFT_56145 [Fistulina hepatica ATCC 64428]|uniref:Enhancer of polycomb-like protein n=1 Tax=Fistulina hepatica ATCC 64428 TaxID=1128425 RepID=A0A0D7AMZ8_9AGAR|nr:hypothetical protein FISHEDRAFT_56145 [Fistulina hepatica ATCC 64428]